MESIREGIGYEKIGRGNIFTPPMVVFQDFCENLFYFSFREAKEDF